MKTTPETIRQDKTNDFLVSTAKLPDGWYEVAVFPRMPFLRKLDFFYDKPVYMRCFPTREKAMMAHRRQVRKAREGRNG